MQADKCIHIHCCLSPPITMPTTTNMSTTEQGHKTRKYLLEAGEAFSDEPSACQTTLDSQRTLVLLSLSPLNSLPILLNFAPRPDWQNESERGRMTRTTPSLVCHRASTSFPCLTTFDCSFLQPAFFFLFWSGQLIRDIVCTGRKTQCTGSNANANQRHSQFGSLLSVSVCRSK